MEALFTAIIPLVLSKVEIVKLFRQNNLLHYPKLGHKMWMFQKFFYYHILL